MTAPAATAATRPNLTLGLLALAHSLIHMQSALMPLVYIAVIDQFGLDEAAIGLFIGVTTAVAGAMQLSYGFLTRYIARPMLIGVGQVVFGVSLMLAGLATSIGQLLAAISGRGWAPARSTRWATASCPTPSRPSGAGSRSAPTSPVATWGRSSSRSSAAPCWRHRGLEHDPHAVRHPAAGGRGAGPVVRPRGQPGLPPRGAGGGGAGVGRSGPSWAGAT